MSSASEPTPSALAPQALGACLGLLLALSASPALAQFSYNPPGTLTPGSGTGREDYTIFVPDMRYPVESAPSFPNSQVWGRGGSQGGGGGQCDSQNYSYPWWDNFCETRQWGVPLCPGGKGHQGQDIRPGTCEKNTHWAVAAEAGEITKIGTYTVYLVTDSGTQHRYLHMDPSTLPVSVGDRVTKGQRLGLISNAFGGTPTTIHLHYDIHQTVSGVGPSYIPLYMSLVDSYERLLGIPQEPCAVLSAQGGVLDNAGPCFRLGGDVSSWRTEDLGHEGTLRWTYAFDGSAPDGWAEWLVELEAAGEYRVEVHVVAAHASSKRARYLVKHGGMQQEVRLDLSAGEGWRELGTFAFEQGGGQSVGIYDHTGEPYADRLKVIADAIRLSPVAQQEDMGPPAEQDMGGAGQPDMRPPSSQPDMRPAAMPPVQMTTPPSTTPPAMSGEEELERMGDGGTSASTSTCVCGVTPRAPARTPLALLLMGGILVWRRKRLPHPL